MSEDDADDVTKCRLDEGTVVPCSVLVETFNSAYGRGTRSQGIKLVSLINMQTHKDAGSVVIAKSGKYSKQGAIFNHCPFCGVWINKYGEAPEDVQNAHTLDEEEKT